MLPLFIRELIDYFVQYRLERLRIKRDIANKPYEMLSEIVRESATAQREQSKILQTWMDGFKVQTIPSSTTTSPLDEYQMEQTELANMIENSDSLSLSEMAAANLRSLE